MLLLLFRGLGFFRENFFAVALSISWHELQTLTPSNLTLNEVRLLSAFLLLWSASVSSIRRVPLFSLVLIKWTTQLHFPQNTLPHTLQLCFLNTSENLILQPWHHCTSSLSVRFGPSLNNLSSELGFDGKDGAGGLSNLNKEIIKNVTMYSS